MPDLKSMPYPCLYATSRLPIEDKAWRSPDGHNIDLSAAPHNNSRVPVMGPCYCRCSSWILLFAQNLPALRKAATSMGWSN